MITSADAHVSKKIQAVPSHTWTVFHVKKLVGAEDIVQAINEYFPTLETADVIWDFSEAVFPAIGESDLAAIMAAAKEHAPKRRDARTVFVCKAPQLFSSIARYISLASKAALTVDYAVHETLDDAERWLTCNRKHRCGSGDCAPGYASCPRGNCRSIRMLQAYRRFWGRDAAPLL